MNRISKTIITSLMIAALVSLTNAQQNAVFTTPAGETISLSTLRGQVVVLVFGGVSDPQCREEFKALQTLADKYANSKVAVFWVSIDAPASVSDAELKAPCGPAGSVKVVRDASRAAFKQFGGKQLPTIVILDKAGNVAGQPRGGFNPNAAFINSISDLIDGLL
ncbi:MAG: TlpA disulfide reductase family protein [Acidobacteriota bacterium]